MYIFVWPHLHNFKPATSSPHPIPLPRIGDSGPPGSNGSSGNPGPQGPEGARGPGGPPGKCCKCKTAVASTEKSQTL